MVSLEEVEVAHIGIGHMDLACLDIDEKVFVTTRLWYAEELEALVEDVKELGVLADSRLGWDL